ncbi:MAG: hypothetical protein LBU42_07715 [Prevotellaceae bacterium]|jgi:hypothetical protein|nr:hypothetical protein [Prevotellaceae bacterium]
MKKIIFLFAMLAGIAASAQRTTPVTIANIQVDYLQTTVTFDLSWTGSDASHRNEVWVFVDIQPVTGANILGSWSPATLVPNATTVIAISGNQYSSLTYTPVNDNTRGVWVKGTAANSTSTFKATVKVTLDSSTPAAFNACAYATDYPPNAASYSNGTYTLKGTPPFTVIGNGTIQNSNQYVGTCITLTDATGCPGGVGRDVIHNECTCAPGLTAVGGYCRDLAEDGASSFTGCNVEVENFNRGWDVWDFYCPPGWDLPTHTHIKCMYDNREQLGMTLALPYQNTFFFKDSDGSCNETYHCSNDTQIDMYIMFFSGYNCTNTQTPPPGTCSQVRSSNGGYWRCVR